MLAIFFKNGKKAAMKTEKMQPPNILIKITHCHYLVRIFLQNRTTDFDETLHVVWVCPGEGFGTIGTSCYSPILKKRRPEAAFALRVCSKYEMFFQVFNKLF